MMEGKAGIYALMQGGEVVYVGQTNNLTRRIGEHIKDGIKDFDSFYARITPYGKAIEDDAIDCMKPKYNKLSGANDYGSVFDDKFVALTIDEIISVYKGNHKGISVDEIADDLKSYKSWIYDAIRRHPDEIKYWEIKTDDSGKIFGYLQIDRDWYEENRDLFCKWVLDGM